MPHDTRAAGWGPGHYRKYWLPDLLLVAGLLVFTLILFQFTDLDLWASRRFFDAADRQDHWPQSSVALWHFFYTSARWVIGGLGLLALLGMLVGTLRPDLRKMRLYSACVILAVAIGPGILVNGILKNYWGRPRPRHITEFNGQKQYLGPMEKGKTGGGKSLPCGHSSTAFAYCVFYFILRRKRPKLAFAILAATAAFGLLMGLGRMAAGAHFLSDVLLSAYLPFLAALFAYHFLLRIPQREDSGHYELPWFLGRMGRRGFMVLIGLGAIVLVATVLLASPFREDVTVVWPRKWVGNAPRNYDLEISHADVTLVLTPSSKDVLYATGRAQGFGYPTNEILETVSFDHEGGRMIYTFKRRGLFSEYHCKMRVVLLDEGLEKVRLRVTRGDINVQADHRKTLPQLDLKTEDGDVSVPDLLMPENQRSSASPSRQG